MRTAKIIEIQSESKNEIRALIDTNPENLPTIFWSSAIIRSDIDLVVGDKIEVVEFGLRIEDHSTIMVVETWNKISI